MAKVSQEETQAKVLEAIKNPYNNMDFFAAVELGLVPGWTYNRKFGRRVAVTTTLTPITQSGVYSTPTSATALEIVSDDADDTAVGAGLRKVRIIGLDSNWTEISQDVTLNGTTPVTIPTSLIRQYRTIALESGSYANQTTPSQQGTITIQASGGGTVWSTLGLAATGFGMGQSLIGCYTVPKGYEAFVYTGEISIENTKAASLYFFQRTNSNKVSEPYSTLRIVETHEYGTGYSPNASGFLGRYDEYTDIGYMGKTASGTTDVSLDFKIYLRKK